jgi:hypothetical protein
MVRDLVYAGFDPAEAMAMIGLPAVGHTGLASVQLQGVAQVILRTLTVCIRMR